MGGNHSAWPPGLDFQALAHEILNLRNQHGLETILLTNTKCSKTAAQELCCTHYKTTY